MAANTILKFDNVSKIFGKNKVVHNLSLEIKEGDLVALLGPSGCGKTTSLRMIAGLERCDEGEIIYQGEVIDSAQKRIFVPPSKRGMGMVFQSYAIWPHMNVFENVAYPLQIRGVAKSKIKEEVKQILELVGLGEMAERKSTQLSGGQQQRVALARSLVFHPHILLLDEPFSNLDAKLREQMRIEVKQLQQRLGITIIFVTHDQVEALSLADRIIMLNKGSVEQIATPKNMYDEPTTPFVRDFLGKTMMFGGKIVSVTPGGEIEVMREGVNPIRLRTSKHYFNRPAVGEPCSITTRAEDITIEPVAVMRARGDEAGGVVFQGKIETLLFIGNQYESVVALNDGERIHLYLPKNFDWHQGQEVALRLDREVTVWPA